MSDLHRPTFAADLALSGSRGSTLPPEGAGLGEDAPARLLALHRSLRRGGHLGVPLGAARPTPAAEETLPEAPVVAQDRLQKLLLWPEPGARALLLRDWVETATLQGYHIPADATAHLLSEAGSDTRLQRALGHAQGETLSWVRTQNPDWVGMGPADTDNWQAGPPRGRKLLVEGWRAKDPDAVREFLQEHLGDLPSTERAELVLLCRTGLHARDEAWLESLLDSKATSVSQAARELLGLLPDSGYHQRQLQRAAELVHVTGRLVKRLEIRHLDELSDDQLARDGWMLPAKVKSGDRNVQLQKFVATIAPSAWEAITQMSPKRLLAELDHNYKARGDMASTFLGGLWDASVLHQDIPWLVALWRGHKQGWGYQPRISILAGLGDQERATLLREATPSAADAGQLLGIGLSWGPLLTQELLRQKQLTSVQIYLRTAVAFSLPVGPEWETTARAALQDERQDAFPLWEERLHLHRELTVKDTP